MLRPEPVGDREQERVAEGVAVGVVDELEAVDVEEQQRDLGIDGCRREVLRQVLVHVGTVGEPGEHVVGGLVGEALLGSGVGTDGAEQASDRGGRQRQHDDRQSRSGRRRVHRRG